MSTIRRVLLIFGAIAATTSSAQPPDDANARYRAHVVESFRGNCVNRILEKPLLQQIADKRGFTVGEICDCVKSEAASLLTDQMLVAISMDVTMAPSVTAAESSEGAKKLQGVNHEATDACVKKFFQ
ncbi:MAG: hypothetical protein HY017_28090 [Betaproteobacteria bacterium]|nr:hypothetical protein [Betaproteobacteria bacterium]